LGLGINFIGINPIKALLYAAIINCIAAVPITAFVLLLANKKEIMGNYKNGLLANVFGWLTFATLFTSSLLTLMYW
jgi:Mn2+/Fe2+ NRAMP family transporter